MMNTYTLTITQNNIKHELTMLLANQKTNYRYINNIITVPRGT